MDTNIHKKVLKRLLLGWFALSLVIGGVAYYWEMEHVDDQVLALATREANTFTSDTLEHFNSIDSAHPERLQLVQAKAAQFLLGVDIIAKSNWLENAHDVVEFHHEKFDGSGYMRGRSASIGQPCLGP